MVGAPASGRRRWIGLFIISLAVALIILDSTIVNVAIPSIVDELHITSTQVQWVQESYTLVFAALLLVFGTLSDRFGRRRLLIIGVVIFALSSAAAAAVGSGDLLIAARFVQGAGGAMILPATLSIINTTFVGRDRGIAFAVWGSTIGGVAALGPLLGGWLTASYSWRWAFGINLPFGVLIIVGLLMFVSESRAGSTHRVDVVSAIISIILFTSLVFGLIEGRTYGWWLSDNVPAFWTFDLSPVPIAFVIAALALIAFVLWGRARQRAGLATMIPFSLFSIASFRNANIAALIVSLGEFGIILSLPLWLQNVLGYNALQTGFILTALAIGSFAASGISASVWKNISPVTTVRAGIVAEIVGLAIIGAVIAIDTPWWAIALGLTVYGCGVGLATAQLTSVILTDVPLEKSGEASGMQSTSRQVGSALGIAVLGTILFTAVGVGLDARLPDSIPAVARTQIVDAVVDSAGSAIPALTQRSAEAGLAAREAFSDGTRYSAYAAAGFLVLGLLATTSLGGVRQRPQAPVSLPKSGGGSNSGS